MVSYPETSIDPIQKSLKGLLFRGVEAMAFWSQLVKFQKLDSPIHQINQYPVDKCQGNQYY